MICWATAKHGIFGLAGVVQLPFMSQTRGDPDFLSDSQKH